MESRISTKAWKFVKWKVLNRHVYIALTLDWQQSRYLEGLKINTFLEIHFNNIVLVAYALEPLKSPHFLAPRPFCNQSEFKFSRTEQRGIQKPKSGLEPISSLCLIKMSLRCNKWRTVTWSRHSDPGNNESNKHYSKNILPWGFKLLLIFFPARLADWLKLWPLTSAVWDRQMRGYMVNMSDRWVFLRILDSFPSLWNHRNALIFANERDSWYNNNFSISIIVK